VPLAYQNLFINLNDAALVIDYKGEIIESNKKSRKMAGRKDLKQQSYWDFCYSIKDIPEPELLQYLDFEGNDGPEIEISVKTEGSLSWYMMKGSRIGDSESEKRGYLLSFRDISLWKKQKNTLEKSATLMGLSSRFAEEMLRRSNWGEVYLEYAPNFKTLTRANGCFISPIKGYEKNLKAAINRESMVWHRTWTNQLNEAANSYPLQDYMEIGRDVFIVLPIELDTVQIGYWVFFWSIDDKEEALRAHDILKLASNVLSSSIENYMTEEDLRLAKETAEQASRAKSEFLSIMSHEIRTPMNGIVGFCNLLRRTRLTPHQSAHLNSIRNASESLLSIINDILDFSKIEAQKMEIKSIPFNLREIVDETITLLATEVQRKQHERVAMVYDDVPSTLVGDSLRLKQVLINLLGNAVKFTDEGDVVVRVMVEQEINNELSIRFSITDNGIGIAYEKQAGLFTPFTQADSSQNRQHGGSGLGLVISKRLVEVNGRGKRPAKRARSRISFLVQHQYTGTKRTLRYSA